MMKTPPLESGIALILAGPQGCGKTRLAKLIGQRHGSVAEMDPACLGRPSELACVLQDKPAVLIIDGLPRTPAQLETLRALVGNPTIKVRQPYSDNVMVTVKVPHVVICTNEIVSSTFRQGRRFRVVDMASRAFA